ncbi:MAG: M20/M25/M40 family metallo-hydrolase [Pseudomonadota bacterium]|nr:M20/M25/M40 family metallo-hydrolase [Pseudomonadota bacterium]
MSRIPLLPATSLIAAALLLAACNRSADVPAASTDPAATAASADSPAGAIDAADFAAHVQTLASDEFGGRAPGSPGEEKTVEYLTSQFKRLGLQPGNGDSYVQSVPMVETTADEATTTLTLNVKGASRELDFGDEMVIGTRTGKPTVEFKDSQLVFVGFGVNAPEQNWNDYEGLDVKGKTVVMFVNDPGFRSQDDELFEGRTMTYYGRWTYKYEEAARQGAAAALIIHETEAASYGWDVVKNSWSGAQFDLPASVDPEPRLPAQGWISADVARSILADLGHDLDKLYKTANERGFKAIPLDASMSLVLNSTSQEKSSNNVVAVLPGSTRPDEAIVYMAHWDHLGDHGHDGKAGAGEDADLIYNGAVDNATGVAGILEIAEAFATQTPAPDRSVVFLAVTLEESGLLGSKYYVANPSVPLENTVAVINLDAMSVLGKSRDMTVVGMGNSQLEDMLKEVASEQGRVLTAEPTPQAGYYFRSDHFNFAKAGVPALYAKGGDDLVEGGTEAGQKEQMGYREKRYHQPADEFDASWPLEGVVQDLEALYGVGRRLAGSEQWPNWYEGNPFRAAREQSRPSAP